MKPPVSVVVDEADLEAAEQLAHAYEKMTKQFSRVVIGRSEVLKQFMIGLFRFTPDLMPSDLTGIEILEEFGESLAAGVDSDPTGPTSGPPRPRFVGEGQG